MKREIKFRGMSLIVGFCEWRYGFFSTYPKGAHITTPDGGCWPVAIESVGQFTGLKDKNGKEIYEGDIVRWEDWRDDGSGYSQKIFVEEPVYFGGGAFYPVCNAPNNEFEVIGNIYENGELLNK